MRATVKMARDKEEERAQARDRMLREEMAKRKARLDSERARKEGSYRTRDDWDKDRERSSGASSSRGSRDHRDRDYGRGRNTLNERDHRRDDRRDRDRDYRRDRR